MSEMNGSFKPLREVYPGLNTADLAERTADMEIQTVSFETTKGEVLGSHNSYPGDTEVVAFLQRTVSRSSGGMVHKLVYVTPVNELARSDES